MTLTKVARKLPYYGASAASLARIATLPSIASCVVLRDKRLRLRRAPPLRLSATLDLLVVKETLVDDVYGLDGILAPSGVIVDVGAGIGDFTLAAASRYPHATVWAFEPNPRAFSLLERNIDSYGCRNVHPFQIAIGTRSTYLLHGVDAGPRASAVATHRGAASSVVHGRRLDEVVPAGPIRLLKIDTEGLELDVLESASGLFERVERVVVEYHRHLLESADRLVARFLNDHGFDAAIRSDAYDDAIGYAHATRSGPSPPIAGGLPAE